MVRSISYAVFAGLVGLVGPTSLADGPGGSKLRGRIEALIAPLGDGVTVAVAFRDLETGEECLIRADEPIHPASTMKVPVMLEVYRQATGEVHARRPDQDQEQFRQHR